MVEQLGVFYPVAPDKEVVAGTSRHNFTHKQVMITNHVGLHNPAFHMGQTFFSRGGTHHTAGYSSQLNVLELIHIPARNPAAPSYLGQEIGTGHVEHEFPAFSDQFRGKPPVPNRYA
jgi:hypothetical protein